MPDGVRGVSLGGHVVVKEGRGTPVVKPRFKNCSHSNSGHRKQQQNHSRACPAIAGRTGIR